MACTPTGVSRTTIIDHAVYAKLQSRLLRYLQAFDSQNNIRLVLLNAQDNGEDGVQFRLTDSPNRHPHPALRGLIQPLPRSDDSARTSCCHLPPLPIQPLRQQRIFHAPGFHRHHACGLPLSKRLLSSFEMDAHTRGRPHRGARAGYRVRSVASLGLTDLRLS